ncbi:cytochrome b5-like [Tachypleus tridentatus]|uniref:cytochrome b5-like n=1 Tax=Tachypleus tridentatus TaxID=6853 RepID=UPI003FD23FBB
MKDIIASIVRLTMDKAGLYKEASICERSTSNSCHIPMYTLADVSEHCIPNDCWLVICDKVYDVTDFLKEHPGGDDIILEYAGRDGTLSFHGTGHSSDTIREMERYCIGMLVENERLNLYTEETPPISVAVVA